MNKVLRCTVLSALFATSMAATVLAAPFQLPVAISTPPVDQINIAGYGDSIQSADVRFTINEDGLRKSPHGVSIRLQTPMVILWHLLKLNILILEINQRHSYIVWVPFYVLVKVLKGLIIWGESILWLNYLEKCIHSN